MLPREHFRRNHEARLVSGFPNRDTHVAYYGEIVASYVLE